MTTEDAGTSSTSTGAPDRLSALLRDPKVQEAIEEVRRRVEFYGESLSYKAEVDEALRDLAAALLAADAALPAEEREAAVDKAVKESVTRARREAFTEMRDFCATNGFPFPLKFDRECTR